MQSQVGNLCLQESAPAHTQVEGARPNRQSRRRGHRVDRPSPEPMRHRLIDWIITCLLASVLAFAPFAFGAVEAWSEWVVMLLTAAIAFCFAIRMFLRRDVEFVRTWAYLPIALFLGVAVLQLIPLPLSVIHSISPNTTALRSQLLSDLPNALQSQTLSLYPHATRHDLRLVLLLATLFFVVVNVYRKPEQIRQMLRTIVLIGAAAALLALAQDLSGATNIFWIGPSGLGGHANAGSFVTYSHYDQMMNLSIGAGLALLLIELHKHFGGEGLTAATALKKWNDPRLRIAWLLGGFIVVGAMTIFLSTGRGAMVALLTGLIFTTLMLPRAHGLHGRAWLTLPLLLGTCAVVLFLGPEGILNRFSSLQAGESYLERWQILKDLVPAWHKFPVLGTGLGSHEVVYPMFSHQKRFETFTHAENEYAQVLEETGMIGLGWVIGFAAILWASYLRATRNTNPPIRLAAFGLGFGLFAIMVQSLSDFGQHLPGVACLSAVSFGLLINLGRLGRTDRKNAATKTLSTTIASSTWLRWPLRLTATSTFALIFSWVLIGGWSARASETHWKDAQAMEQALSQMEWNGSNADMARLITQASTAATLQPGDIKSRYSLDAYRWHAISRVRDAETGQIILGSHAMESIARILDDLHQARALCPTYAPLYVLAAELNTMIGLPEGEASNERDLRAVYLLSSNRSDACFPIAALDARWEMGSRQQ